jgi:predicted small secreted protein
MKNRVTKTVLVIAVSACALCAVACETVKGAGKDVQYAGEKTQEALQKAGAPK